MRAAVVVILATITGIVALLNFKPESLTSFGAPVPAGAAGPNEIVAVPQARVGVGGAPQPRLRPSVTPRPSRSDSRRTELPQTRPGRQSQIPKDCKVLINGRELDVTALANRTTNLRLPVNGTLTLRCGKNGILRSAPSSALPSPPAAAPEPAETAPTTPGQGGAQGQPGQSGGQGQPGDPGQQGDPNAPPGQDLNQSVGGLQSS
jgi:hypothetical protein